MAKLTLTDPSAGYNSTSVITDNNDLIEAAVENTLSRDGTSPNQMEANIDMNSNYIRNLADGINNQDAVTIAQLNGTISGELLSVSVATLSDVGVGTPTDGNVLVGDGDSWESTTFVASYFDAEASTDGYVLTSDGAGNADWEAVAVLASNINSNGSADGYVLTSDGANGTAWEAVPAGGSVAGADTQVQFNNSGAFGASANLTWDDDTLYIKCGSATEPHLHLDGGYNTDRPYIRLNNSLDSETKILQSWNSETNINLKVYYEFEHAHNLSDERLNIACKGNGVSSAGNRLSLFENSSSQTYNVTTGAGMERILTTSDLGGANVTYTSGVTATWAPASNFVSQSGATSTYNSGAVTKFEDNANLTFGTGSDVNLDFDGTNFVLNGTGLCTFTGFDGVSTDSYFQLRTETTTNIADVTHAVNTSAGKVQGAMIWDSTADKMKVATGSADASTWVDADGTNAVTPA